MPTAATAGLAAAFLVASHSSATNPGDRTISFYHIHTQERLTVTYKRDGRYDADALKKIDWIMRDWRKNQAIKIDPATIDLAWEMYNELGAREPISIICGYRSPSTNEMLRKTQGGQASQSQHMTGRAIDITFPDVPLKRMRYSALVRERGGVGYYPTSGIPFVHIDTARVRAWPRLPRQELALLFPEGHSRHMPSDGGPITPSDVRAAQTKYRELAVQIAQFHDDRRNGRSAATLVASAQPASGRQPFAVASLGAFPAAPAQPQAPSKQISLTWEKLGSGKTTAEGGKAPPQERKIVAAFAPPQLTKPKPQLVATPKLVDRSSRFTPTAAAPTDKDRLKLDGLVQQASLQVELPAAAHDARIDKAVAAPKLVATPKPAVRPQKALAAAAMAAASPAELPPQATAPDRKVAALASQASSPGIAPTSITDMSPESLGTGWVQAPEFDEDHPEELAYRPFALAPLLTDTPSPHDSALMGMQHPDVAATLDMIDDAGAVPPMRFRPGLQVAQVMWAQQFEGKAVHLDALKELDDSRIANGTGIENRAVKTSSR